MSDDDNHVLLSRMLDEAHELPPWLVPAYARRYAEALGARRTVIYLQDYDQRVLVALTDDALKGSATRGLSIDDSVAGRTFMTGTTSTQSTDDGSSLLLPLIDGTDRVGVLEIELDVGEAEKADLDQWSALAANVAELIVVKGAHTDVYFRARRHRPMGLAAEMQWQLLPPLTVTDPRVAIAGCLEPAYEVGGDAFDYAINNDVAHVAIFDAMGHGTGASVMAGVAVGAYRHARRAGIPVEEMYAAVSTAFSDQFGEERFVTAQLATLDLNVGNLVLVNAGHPAPMLVRGRQVVSAIEGPSALPIGLGDEPPALTQVQLEPGDRVVFYSDGVVDAQRDEEHYDEARFALDIEDVLAEDMPLAETVRRINRRLVDWRGGATRDDATFVFVQWRTSNLPDP